MAEQVDSSPPASPVGAGGVGVAEPPRSPASPAPTELEALSSDEGAEGDVEAGAAGDRPASLGYRLNGDATPPETPGERMVDWFLQNRWAEVMPWADPLPLLDYGIHLTEAERVRGRPWGFRPWPPPHIPELIPERLFGPYGGRVAGGDWVLPNGQVLWLNPAGPMREAPGPSDCISPSPALVRRRRPVAGVSARIARRLCSSCGLRACFCLTAVSWPSGRALEARARPAAGSRCDGEFVFCECEFGVCGA